MKGTLKIATMFKIPVYLHWSFPLIFLYILFIGNQIGAAWQEMSAIAVFVLIVFFCVLLHEYGHALTARRYGVNTRDIILSPIGGIARLERIPNKPIEELKVAIMGPAVNVVIALLLLPFCWYMYKAGIIDLDGPDELSAFQNWNNIVPLVLGTNVLLVVFNMIPAFPMDGGRVLRSVLAMKMDRVKATKIAYIVAQVAAVMMFIYGLYDSQYIICFIALFVILTSRVEWKSVVRESALAGKMVKDLMQPITQKLYNDQTIQNALDLTNNQTKNFLVFDREDKVIGVLFYRFLEYAIKEKDYEAAVEKYRSNTWENLSSHYPIENAIALFQQKGYGILPIIEHNELVGQLDMLELNRYVKRI